ncbi:winged helix-turn-helix domain-containing protein [Lacimicrobium sp. SS2-24]|uniref:winged helix-turn-helix domain-containing protein n=1 Tax=Lacimicrobium sp. SS2-24 TaxID=2005569 RepID=UPI000B4B69AE|nr:winged helix-turn-helix domain-containing protein [Lacimicrobium sp. SS2-24]
MPTEYQLSHWHIVPQLCQMRNTRTGEEIHLQPRVMDVLVLLCESPQQLVSREHFFAQVWENSVRVDEVLTSAISQLRKILGDTPRSPTYIKTIHKKGYILLQPASSLNPGHSMMYKGKTLTAWAPFFANTIPMALNTGKRLATTFSVIAAFTYYVSIQPGDEDALLLAQATNPTPSIEQPIESGWSIHSEPHSPVDQGRFHYATNRQDYAPSKTVSLSNCDSATKRRQYSAAI